MRYAGRWSGKSTNLFPYDEVRFCDCSSTSRTRCCGGRGLRQWDRREWEHLWEANKTTDAWTSTVQDENTRAGWLWMTRTHLYLESRSAHCVLTRKSVLWHAPGSVFCVRSPVAFSELRLTGREKRNQSEKKWVTVRSCGSCREQFSWSQLSQFVMTRLCFINYFIGPLWSDHLSSCQLCCCHLFQVEEHSWELHQDVEEDHWEEEDDDDVLGSSRSVAKYCSQFSLKHS